MKVNHDEWKNTLDTKPKRAMLIGVYLKLSDDQACEESLIELARLSDTCGVEVAHKNAYHLRHHEPSTFLTSGKLDEFVALAKELDLDLVIFDDALSPSQQKNLEEAFGIPVLDRAELIMEVFAIHAHTKEARLQIELAKVRYMAPRLKRLWTHLSRQSASGGSGFMLGEGEKQRELDSRMLEAKLDILKRELEDVRRVRETQRQLRKKTKIPTFAIVGYTNVGKSTLLNALTDAGVLAEDKLFATLDTTTKKFILPNHQAVLLIDTVGFISKIPHTLVEAFRSTLEEAAFADLRIHLIDASSPYAERQAADACAVLTELGVDTSTMITVLNKVDACEDPIQLERLKIKYGPAIEVSALHRTGFDNLFHAIEKAVANLRTPMTLRIPQKDYHLVSELIREGHILTTEYEENDILLTAEVPKNLVHLYESYAETENP